LNENSNAINGINQQLDVISQTTKDINYELLDVVKYFDDVDQILVSRIDDLEIENINLETSNGDLSHEIDDLLTIMSFLDRQRDDFNKTVEVISSYLANRIHENQDLLLYQLDMYFTSLYNQWNNGPLFKFQFGSKSWVIDIDLPMSDDDYTRLIDYVDKTLLNEMCIDRQDFDQFLTRGHDDDVTFRDVDTGIIIYCLETMQYYFSGSDDSLTTEAWIDAEYNCANFPKGKAFQYPY